jgi:tRNA/rRNA methyltransferase
MNPNLKPQSSPRKAAKNAKETKSCRYFRIGSLPTTAEIGRLRVVLVAPRNPLNIGAAARAMSNFGLSQLRLVNPYYVAFRQATSAVGASDLLTNAVEYKTVAEAVADCALVVGTTAVGKRHLHQPLRRLEQGGSLIRKRLHSGNVALLFGSEKRGLSNEDFSHCHWLMRIPTSDKNISMNLGQAVAVCLYELARDAKVKTGKKTEYDLPATAGELEQITGLLLDALHISGYIKPGSAANSEEKVRRLIRRLNLPSQDAVVWLGILRQILWKVNAGAKSGR